MAGELLGGIALIEPVLKACYETYGFYRLTRNFGEDYHKAERGLRGQMARLKLIGDIRISNLIVDVTTASEPATTIRWTLEGMKGNFERCEELMRTHGEPAASRSANHGKGGANHVHRSNTPYQTPPRVPSTSDNNSLQPESTTQGGKRHKGFRIPARYTFSRSASSSPQSGSMSDRTSLHGIDSTTAIGTANSSMTSASLSIDVPKVLQDIYSDQIHSEAASFQASSSLLGRLKWAVEDRHQFFGAIEELTKANDLLESLLRLKLLEDTTVIPSGRRINNAISHSISDVRSELETLHNDLLRMNLEGKAIDFSLKLEPDTTKKEKYKDYVDEPLRTGSRVYSLQAHPRIKHINKKPGVYLLAEILKSTRNNEPAVKDLSSEIREVKPETDPPFKILGLSSQLDGATGLRIYQDQSSEWIMTQDLYSALRIDAFQDASFQRHCSELAVLVAFSYAAMPFIYVGKSFFPQTSNYTYYDITSCEPDISMPAQNLSVMEDLLSPWFHYDFGSRPQNLSTRNLGQRPGINAPNSNALVALGILLYQIGSWRPLCSASTDITQQRREALDRTHDLVRSSGVEFTDIVRTCLNWKENGREKQVYKTEDMLVEVYTRLLEYNRELQSLV